MCTQTYFISPDLSVGIQEMALITLSVFPQGVEFFDEKLNTLCMAWLIDHGKALAWIKVFQVGIPDMNKWNSLSTSPMSDHTTVFSFA